MTNFWDSDAWGFLTLLGALLGALMFANFLKRKIGFLRRSLVPASVLGGIVLLIVSFTYTMIVGKNEMGEYRNLFSGGFFNGNVTSGLDILYVITYHCLALGFAATTLGSTKKKLGKKRAAEIFNTGVTTVSSYLMQGVLGMGITLGAALVFQNVFSAAGILLPFGFGQGTGQAMNYGSIYEVDYGFAGGKNFGLTIAAIGFLCAAIGGLLHLNHLRRKGVIPPVSNENVILTRQIEEHEEVTPGGGADRFTIQFALIAIAYFAAYLIMLGLSALIPSMISTIYGFNFLFAVLTATAVRTIVHFLKDKNIGQREYISPYLMARISGFFFDLMIVAGFAAIQLELLADNWLLILILGVVGMFSTYLYNFFVAKTLFSEYKEEQFMVMYGMLTGTASTGIVLLHEIDPEYKTPAADNLVYQNFPAIVFGFPMMLLASLAPKEPLKTFWLLLAFFVAMNIILFRRFIFKRRKK
jgi:ESS family glutamate:Na+ symporter